MTILPQHPPIHSLNYSQLASGFASSLGWKFSAWGMDTGKVWLTIERNDIPATLRGGIALAWLEQEKFFGANDHD